MSIEQGGQEEKGYSAEEWFQITHGRTAHPDDTGPDLSAEHAYMLATEHEYMLEHPEEFGLNPMQGENDGQLF
jgi:hypothetical protein